MDQARGAGISEAPRTRGVLGSLSRAQQVLFALLLVVATSLVIGILGLTASMLQQTDVLGEKVDLTEGIVDANVRTLSQVQREILQLEVLLQQPDPKRSDLVLRRSLVSQRVQEGTLSYQLQTLGTEDLLQRAREYAAQWQALEPEITAHLGTSREARARRTELIDELRQLELGYNQLVSDGENNRKVMAGEANTETRTLLARADRLVTGLIITLVSLAVLLTIAGLTFASLHRQRERANQELVGANARLRRDGLVVRATDNMVVVTDSRGRIDWVNPAFERRTGHRLPDIVGHSPGDLLQGPATDPVVVAEMAAAVREGRSFNAELVNYTIDGEEFWLALDVNPLHDESGRLTGFVAVETDVTERRRSEQLLLQAKEAAEETARTKTQFLASMSHEIRTPLNAVLGLTDLLLLTELDADQREYVRTAHSSSRLLLALVNDILDYSALENGRVAFEQRAFDLDALVKDTVDMFETEGRRRGVPVELAVAGEVPAHVVGDETRLRQVLVNLVGNALKFTERGSVLVEVGVGSMSGESPVAGPGPGEGQPLPAREWLRVEVHDTGIGMSTEQLERLFQPFTQGDASTTRRFGGTGLGLAISRLLAQGMGGRIAVDSELGRGSTFTLWLPLTLADAAAVPEAPAAPSASDLSGLRILLAEDDLVNQTVARHMLARLGVRPVVVGDGEAAVEAVRRSRFDVVLMDVHMPRMDGISATAAIRALDVPQPIIVAVTANALEGDRERLLASGMDGYLSKPVQLATLRDTLYALVGQLEGRRPAVDTEEFAARTGVEDDEFLASLVAQVLTDARGLIGAAQDPDRPALADRAFRLAGSAAATSLPGVEAAARACHDAFAVDGGPEAAATASTAALAQLDSAIADAAAWLATHASVERQ